LPIPVYNRYANLVDEGEYNVVNYNQNNIMNVQQQKTLKLTILKHHSPLVRVFNQLILQSNPQLQTTVNHNSLYKIEMNKILAKRLAQRNPTLNNVVPRNTPKYNSLHKTVIVIIRTALF
jgi:hypothetical protein